MDSSRQDGRVRSTKPKTRTPWQRPTLQRLAASKAQSGGTAKADGENQLKKSGGD